MYPLISSSCVFLAMAPASMVDKRFVALPMMTAFVRSASVKQRLEKAYSASFSGSGMVGQPRVFLVGPE